MTSQFLYFDNVDGGGATGNPHDAGTSSSNRDKKDLNLLDAASSNPGQAVPTEVFPVGMFNPAPETDDPIYYSTGTARDGKTPTVGPFDLTGRMIREWANNTTSSDLDELVSRGAMRPSTAMAVKSATFGTVLDMLEKGQMPNEAMRQRLLPGDVQRAVEIWHRTGRN